MEESNGMLAYSFSLTSLAPPADKIWIAFVLGRDNRRLRVFKGLA
jgi:hypothetical protein